MTVRELLARIDAQELTEWMAFYGLEPWGTEPADVRAGIIAATVANTARDPKAQPKPFQPSDFLPGWDREPEPEQSAEEIKAALMEWQRALQASRG